MKGEKNCATWHCVESLKHPKKKKTVPLVLPEGNGDPIREEFLLCPVDLLGGLVVIAPARTAGDPDSNPGPGENFSLKLLIITKKCS